MQEYGREITLPYTCNEKMKINSGFGIYTTIYHNGSYLLLFGNKQWQSFETSYE